VKLGNGVIEFICLDPVAVGISVVLVYHAVSLVPASGKQGRRCIRIVLFIIEVFLTLYNLTYVYIFENCIYLDNFYLKIYVNLRLA
jgi:hypothetical protein